MPKQNANRNASKPSCAATTVLTMFSLSRDDWLRIRPNRKPHSSSARFKTKSAIESAHNGRKSKDVESVIGYLYTVAGGSKYSAIPKIT